MKLQIIKMTFSLRVREVKLIKHEINEYVIVLIYLLSTNFAEIKIITFIIRELHLINEFKVKMFINNNILSLKEIFINITQKKTVINNCKVTINVFVRHKDEYVHKRIHARKIMLMFSHFKLMILIFKSALLKNKDFYFS